MRKICYLIMALSLSASSAFAQTAHLTIIESSDVHGRFFPYDDIKRAPIKGSLARLSTYLRQLRKAHHNVVLLDNGDILQGQPSCYYYNYIARDSQNIAAKVVNYLGYDAEAMGNHDVETGHEVYDKWAKELKCPLLGANIIDVKTGEPYFPPYTIINRSGVKVAVIGMITPAIPSWLSEDLWSGLRFDNLEASAAKWVKIVKEKEHPDLIVGLFHSGREGGIKTADYIEDASIDVARNVPGFDIILFGHDHTPFKGEITNTEGHKVLCLDPSCFAAKVAQADVYLTKSGKAWKVDSIRGKLVDLSQFDIDKDYMAHFDNDIKAVHYFIDRKIGEFASPVNSEDCFFGSAAFTDLVHNLQLQITGADISFNAPLSRDANIAAGPVRVSDMFDLYKYENQIYVLLLTGDEIRRHLEMSYDLWVNTMSSPTDHLFHLSSNSFSDQQRAGFANPYFNFDSAAGIKYIVDVTKPDGQKVKILSMADGTPFDLGKTYRVAMNSYRGNGGGELLTRGAGLTKDEIAKRIVFKSKLDQRYYLMKEIEKMGTVTPKANNNWKFVPDSLVLPAAKRDRELLFGNK